MKTTTNKKYKLYKNISIDELMKFKIQFRKNFISIMTDARFKIPADTKNEALIKWGEIGVIFDATIDDILKTRDWRDENY